MLTCIPVSVVHLCEPRDSYGISRQHCCNRLEPRFNVFLLLNCFRNLIFHITFVTFLGQVANDDSIFLLGLSLAYGKMNNILRFPLYLITHPPRNNASWRVHSCICGSNIFLSSLWETFPI